MRNGYVPDSLLAEVEPGKLLESATAAAYLKAKTASGGLLKIASPAGAYRSYAVQEDMKANPERYGLDPNSSVPVSAPGTSTHGLGTRLDLVVGAARIWAVVNLPRFGFRREFGSADPGHWQYLHPTFAATDTVPIPEDDMFSDADRKLLTDINTQLGNVHAGIWKGGKVQIDGVTQEFKYGVLPIVANSQAVEARAHASQLAVLGALQAAVDRLALGQGADPVAIRQAAEEGAKAALANLDFAGAVEEQLADDFARIAPAVIEEQKKPGN